METLQEKVDEIQTELKKRAIASITRVEESVAVVSGCKDCYAFSFYIIKSTVSQEGLFVEVMVFTPTRNLTFYNRSIANCYSILEEKFGGKNEVVIG